MSRFRLSDTIVAVSLSNYKPTTLSFYATAKSSMFTRLKVSSTLLVILLSWTLAGAAEQPNVLFIAVDDLRPEFGCYGNKIAKTPNLDRIASRGTAFDRAYCQQAVCSPSRTSIMTGLRPDVTKVWDLETHFRVAQPDCITLPEYFKNHGYHTCALSKIYHAGFEDGRSWNEPHWYPKGRAVDTDPIDWTKQIVTRHDVNVEEYANPIADGPARKNGKSPKKGGAFEVSPKEDDQLPDGATAAEAVKRLSALKSKGKPFFLAIGFLKPHLPFVAPKKYWDLYDPNTIPVPTIDRLPKNCPEFAGHDNGELHSYPGVPKENPIPADYAKNLRHGYYACISYVDAQVGRLLDALDKEGLADNTIIVVWGDHGWQLGDHGLWHKHTNFEMAARVPLLISLPNQKTAGRHCAAPVEFLDVYPTLADLCGLPQPDKVDGKSLKKFIENPSAPSTDVAISQYPRKDPDSGLQVMGYSVRNDRWRATFWRDRNGPTIVATELYDEQNDPTETVSLANKPEHKALLETLVKHLPPVGSASMPKKDSVKPKANSKPKSNGKPSTNGSPLDRSARFDQLDKQKAGKVSREQYLARQSDVDAAEQRFSKWDTDKDGFLSRQEFISQGK
jgi:iduronate 2-sulfatase